MGFVLFHRGVLGEQGTILDMIAALRMVALGFPGGAVVESPPADAGDTGSCPGPGRSHMLQSS